MDYSRLLQRSWNIVIQNPFLILFGILLALTSSSPGSNSSYTFSNEEVNQVFGGTPFADQFNAWAGVAMAALIGFMCLAFAIFIVLWILQQVARGALIAGVDDIDADRTTSLGGAWRAGWERKWTLLGIGLLMLIPVLALIAIGVVGFFAFFAAALGSGDIVRPEWLFGGTAVAILGALCILIPVALFLTLWSEFAYRACMLEGKGVIDAFGRGWSVLAGNVGPVVVIVLIRIGIAILLFLPLLVGSICCLLWPILVIVQGAVATYFSTVWTLAWREFTDVPSLPSSDVPALP